jgi:FSR family fosmidomycin resistance protein-like MFS transporter
MQMPLGIIADRLNRNYLVAVAGCVLAGAAFGFTNIPVAATVVIGLGNALFHLGGGIDVLNISGEKLSALGIFVSPGAFGIYLGTILGKGSVFPAIFFPIALITAAVLIFISYKAQRGTYPRNAAFTLEGAGSGQMLPAIVLFFLVVCLRSYVGLALDFPWKSSGNWGVALICAVIFGKTLGGFTADSYGLRRTASVSLCIAALCFLFPDIPLVGVASVLLLNMTMPLTLWAMAKIMPGAKGFSFGLLTFGLFLGFLPVYFGADVSPVSSWLFTLFAALSLILLQAGLRKAKL